MPLAPSVSTISAPYAFKSLRRSTLIVSGMVRMSRYPLTAQIAASPMPVFPLVGSIMTVPAFTAPRFSASASMEYAARSFTLPEGLKYSIFASKRAFKRNSFCMFSSATRGVFPISWVIFR